MKRKFLTLSGGLCLLGSGAVRAQGLSHSSPDSATRASTTAAPEVPGDRLPVSSDNPAAELNGAWQKLDAAEKGVAAKMLLFWSLANRAETPSQVVDDAGVSSGKLDAFKKNLSGRMLLSSSETQIVRQAFADAHLPTRLRARTKIVGLVEKLQSDMPEMRNVLTEMLTVWGEARGIQGFTEEDDTLQQAKMASIVHVLRNRTERRMEVLRKKGENPLDYIERWRIATTRYQFSAFEPYDPNLALIGLGPVKRTASWSFDSLPRNDQRALLNLARVIARMDSGRIRIPEPLGQKSTRHYLTPTLIRYNRKQEKNLKATWTEGTRFRVLRIPTTSPQFLAVVPNWAQQKKLIAEPPVVLDNRDSANPVQIKIPPKDFVYFGGVL